MSRILTLKKNYEFKKVLNRGKYYIENQIIVYINKNRTDENHVGIAINTKLCHAFRRNRLKRLIRENYRLIQSNLNTGNDLVFLWNKKVNPENADFYTIKNDMYNCFKKANLLKEDEKN